MNSQQPSAMFLSASETLKLACEQEQKKPQYTTNQHDPCLALWIASAVKQNNPEAFDLENPADLMIWGFVAGD
jgi:hypothetical protein